MDGVDVEVAGAGSTELAPDHGVGPERGQVYRVDQIDRAGVVEQRRVVTADRGRGHHLVDVDAVCGVEDLDEPYRGPGVGLGHRQDILARTTLQCAVAGGQVKMTW